MGDTARALGIGPEVEFEGKSYRIGPMTFELQAKFETWLERRAIQSVQKHRSLLGEEDYKRALGTVSSDIAAGVYSWGSEKCVESVKTMPGIKELLRLRLSKNDPSVDDEFVDRFIQTRMDEAEAALKEANDGPLPMTPPPEAGAA